jgi:hypothetical protein
MFGASQQRVEELKRALQDAYTWAYTSGRLSALDSIMERAAVPLPAGVVTRTRVIRVWEEGCEKSPKRGRSRRGPNQSEEITWMLHYTSIMYSAPLVGGKLVREWLWNVADSASRLLSEDFDVLPRALEEYSRAAEKHPGMTLECDGHTDATRPFALVEEIGEVAACLTYDNDAETGHGSDLESEVIQVIALAWATRYLDGGE